jgi:hypothetical protein
VFLMRIGSDCRAQSSARATLSKAGWRVEMDGTTVTLAGDEVNVESAPMTAAMQVR